MLISHTSKTFSRRAKIAAKAIATANDHRMGRWTQDGMCECERCGAALIASDCLIAIDEANMGQLGSLAHACPRPLSPFTLR